MGALVVRTKQSQNLHDVIVMAGSALRHVLLRRAIRTRGNDYVLRSIARRR